jgi:squalene-hopene/tetraprenyl-beta-curcumene cyclase
MAIMAFTSHPQVARQYKDAIEKGKKFLLQLQCDEQEGYRPKEDRFYGGFGYGSSERPDLSNTQYALEALKAAGLPPDDPALKKAVLFLQRCQNRSESNDLEWAGNDGGFVYYPGYSFAGTEQLPNGKVGHRSYGSMTYAGIKSYIYANLTKDDPRVKAAYNWIRRHYDLSQNPGAGQQGLFYYYQTFAKTFQVLQESVFVDDKDITHNWREDLAQMLIAKQNPDGSWKNPNPRWWEADPRLATAYAVLSLSLCLGK